MNEIMQIILAVMAAVAAIASAVAAWKSQESAKKSLIFQKKLAKRQDIIFLINFTLENLWRLKKILVTPDEVSDEEFDSVNSIYNQIKVNLEKLVQLEGLTPAEQSIYFSAEQIGKLELAVPEIDSEIKRLRKKIDEIYS